MPFVVKCGGCQKKLKIPDVLVGKPVKCSGCGRKLATSSKPSPPVKSKPPPQPDAVPAKTKVAASPKPAPGAKPDKKVPKTGVTSAFKKPAAPKPAPVPEPTAIKTPAPPKSAPGPPNAVKAGPAPSKPRPIPQRSSKDDDEGSAGKLVTLGGGFVGISLVGIVLWWLFFTGTELGTLTGTVTLDGKPLEGADVIFIGFDNPNLATFKSVTREDGSYTSHGASGIGIVPGTYKVTINKLVLWNGKPIPPGLAGNEARDAGHVKDLIPPEYSEQDKTQLRAVVKVGGNKAAYDLSSRNK